MKMYLLLLLTFLFALGKASSAQSLTGVWKGSSICQVKNSPCHDESVVYHISKGGSPNAYEIQANKIIDGKEVDMGTLYFTFDAPSKIFGSVDSVKQVRWEFKVTGSQMHGTLQ